MRGCERRIYHVKNAGSPLFEEAYLILRQGALPSSPDPGSRADEAERIIR